MLVVMSLAYRRIREQWLIGEAISFIARLNIENIRILIVSDSMEMFDTTFYQKFSSLPNVEFFLSSNFTVLFSRILSGQEDRYIFYQVGISPHLVDFEKLARSNSDSVAYLTSDTAIMLAPLVRSKNFKSISDFIYSKVWLKNIFDLGITHLCDRNNLDLFWILKYLALKDPLAQPVESVVYNRTEVECFLKVNPNAMETRLLGLKGTNQYAKSLSVEPKEKIKICVVGGYWEYVHSQLCFYNYFDTDRGLQEFQYATYLDEDFNSIPIGDFDLLIISRGKHPGLGSLVRRAKSMSVPSIYMLDDNWFSIHREWPEYRDLFSPTGEIYKVFSTLIRDVDWVLVYSSIIESEVRKINRKVCKLGVNINLKQFVKDEAVSRKTKKVIGYVGSARKNDMAFCALAEFIRDNSNSWSGLFFGAIPEVVKTILKEHMYTHVPYVDYSKYVSVVTEMAPDILIAPLDNSITSKSKCPNKYLEITACGAVGIYSKIEPYSEVIVDGVNGFFVEDSHGSVKEKWRSVIDKVAGSEGLDVVRSNAMIDVGANYDVHARYDSFVSFLRGVLSE